MALITAAFPGTVVAAPAGVCPVCGRTTPLSHAGHPALCLRCTEHELPGSSWINSLRIEQGLSWRVVLARLEEYGAPVVSPKRWVHSIARQRAWKGPRQH